MRLDFDQFDKAYNEDIEARHRWKEEKLAQQKQRQRIQGYLLYGMITLLAFAVVASIINGYVHMNRIVRQRPASGGSESFQARSMC